MTTIVFWEFAALAAFVAYMITQSAAWLVVSLGLLATRVVLFEKQCDTLRAHLARLLDAADCFLKGSRND